MTIEPNSTDGLLRETAHELRAPLGGIEAMIEMLSRTPLDAEQARIVEALAASAAHLRAIANEVLGQPANPGPAHVADPCLETLATSCRARAQARGLEFRLALVDPEICHAADDPRRLRQVIENLVDNAFRLTDRGHVEVMILRASKNRMRVSVADTGPGLSAEDAERLIREGGGLPGRAGGAGIGLGIAGRMVASHGGVLQGGPAPGGGASFTFDWPLVETANGPLVLIVDDHVASRSVLATILGAAGYATVEAASAEAAIAAVAARRPAVVMTDLRMPEGGGEHLIQTVAAMPEGDRPRVIIVSADQVDPSNPLTPIVDAVIRKPISVRGVLEAVAAVANTRLAAVSRADAA